MLERNNHKEQQGVNIEAERGNSLAFALIGIAGTAIATGFVSTFAFSRKTRQLIRQRDGNKCVETGATENLQCAH